MAPGWRQRGLGSALITALEQRLFAVGVRAVHAALPEGETGADALHNCDFGARPGLVFQLIERRLVLPLAHPELAAQHGVELSRAVMLFGPPGTGKSTFAHAIASLLGLPFLELFPARLAAEYGLATGLNRRFDEIARLD
ncbi:GNAT family N-acetyltransferase, partial [Streptomyces longwoodensis]|uniref:GNAT family N-acetyltransferase n=1 Tax=Streptomyces longwoodensis TaxID=68231 RepID=UPI0033F2C70B